MSNYIGWSQSHVCEQFAQSGKVKVEWPTVEPVTSDSESGTYDCVTHFDIILVKLSVLTLMTCLATLSKLHAWHLTGCYQMSNTNN